MGDKRRIIRASEIGEYNYCSRAWWYRHVVKLAPPDKAHGSRLARGQEAHARHGRAVSTAITLRMVGIGLLLSGLLVLIVIVFLTVR